MKFTEIQDALRDIGWREFESFVVDALCAMDRFSDIRHNSVMGGHQIDVVAEEKDPLSSTPVRWLFEIKAWKRRIGREVIERLHFLSQSLGGSPHGQRVVLVCNIPPTKSAAMMARQFGIEIWDPLKLIELVPSQVLQKYFGSDASSALPDRESETKTRAFHESLSKLRPGRNDWFSYQRLVSEMFEYLFCPPLESPRDEVPDADARNRRDIILENGAPDGFWSRLRTTYAADFVVVYAKNYVAPLKKTPILDVAHYLKPHGCGMFAIIASRSGAGPSAIHAVREQWIASRKMILVLDDQNLKDMIDLKQEAGDPEDLLRRHIAEFRMSL
ncbi:MAG: restriction endonuclease [Gemmatimonadota bacterium]|nr:MAG: restriction endonuclease [Gemmatimonadota bacterium]